MPLYSLRLSLPRRLVPTIGSDTFLWTNDSRGSFKTAVGPRLGVLGPVPQPNVELVRLAAAVYAADRTTPRREGGANWSRREIGLTIPVWDLDRWQTIAADLVGLLGLLSGDQWDLEFVRASTPRGEPRAARPAPVERAVLLSGGADSLCGALLSRHELAGAPQVLVSHVSWTNLAPIQRTLASDIERLVPGGPQRHEQISFSRRRCQPLSGRRFPNEYSLRSRSLLFVSLGLAVAAIDRVPLWVPENGFASINPPLGPERRGSLSTRTTHPRLLEGLTTVLTAAGVHAEIVNPFASLTKGEVFRLVRDLLGNEEAAGLLGQSHSCGHSGGRSFGFPATEHCGVCFGCLVRRAAFLASGLTDTTPYIANRSPSPERDGFLARKSAVAAARFFTDRGIRQSDIASLCLPPSYPAQEAYDLCKRGAAELRLLWL